MDSFVCDKCGKKFTAKTNLTRHEKTHVHIMLKVEQEGERLNKTLNELEDRLLHIKHKPTRYFQVIRDLENKHFNDNNHFKTNSRKRKLSV